MDNKCPKCGQKLKLFYLKENCPNCGANILYYDMEARLEADAEKAEAEFAKLDAFLEKRTPKFVKKIMAKEKDSEASSGESGTQDSEDK